MHSGGSRNTPRSIQLKTVTSPEYIQKEVDICADLLNLLGVDGLRAHCKLPRGHFNLFVLKSQVAEKV